MTTFEGGTVETFTVRPNTDPVADTVNVDIVSLDITEGTVSPATLSWTTADYTTAKTVTVTPVDEAEIDGNQVYTIELDPITSSEPEYAALAVQTISVTNTDDDAAGFTFTPTSLGTAETGLAQTFTVRPNTDPLADIVTVNIVSLDLTEGLVSPASLTWSTADYTTAKTVTVTPVDDAEVDGGITFDIELDPIASSEANYGALAVQTVSVTNSDDDTAGFTITPGTLATDELGAPQTFTIRPNTSPGADTVTVDITSLDVTEGSASPATLSWTSADFTTAKTVTVTPVDDAEIDGNLIYNIELDPILSSETNYSALPVQTVAVTNSDDDAAGFTITPGSLTTGELGAPQTFTIRPNTDPLTDTVTVDISSLDTTEGTVSPATLSWTTLDYTTAKTVTVTPADDVEIDGNQIYDIELDPFASTEANYSALAVQTVSVTNTDDDAAAFTITPTSLTTSEAGAPQTFTIRPNTDPLGDIVSVTITSLDTTEGTVSPAALSWTAVDFTTAKTVTVTPADDVEIDGNLIYDIELDPFVSTEANYSALAVQTVSVTNTDDDAAGFTITPTSLTSSEAGAPQTFTIRPNTDPLTDTVTVDIVSLDTTEGTVSPATLSWTTADYTTPKTVTVTPVDDVEIDGNQVYDVELDPFASTEANYSALSVLTVSVTNTDDDAAGFTITPTSLTSSEAGAPQTFTVRPNTDPGVGFVIDVDIVSLDITEGTVSPAMLSWTTADYTTAKTVTVTPVDDALIDGNQVYDVELDPFTSTEANYSALSVLTVSVTNTDDDAAAFTITPTSLTTGEVGAPQTFTIRPNTDPVADTVTVDIFSLDLTEGTVSPATLSWTTLDYTTAKTVTVTPVDDVLIDGNLVYDVELDPFASTEANYSALSVQTVSVTNVDDDAPGGFIITPTSLTTDEVGAPQTFTIRPTTDPVADTITVDIVSLDLTEGAVSPSTLSWTTADYTTAKTVTVTPVDDVEIDGNLVYDVELDPFASTEANYSALSVQTVSVTNTDDDSAGFTITPTSLTTDEVGAPQTFTIRPNTDPLADIVSVTITSLDSTEGTVSPATLSWTTADYTTAKTVTVTPVDDALDDGNQVYDVELDPFSSTEFNYSALSVQTVSVTNTDDDTAGFTFTPTSLTTDEVGAPQTFTIRPNTEPVGVTVITVDIVSLDLTEGTVSPATLSWNSADYTTAKTVTVTPVDDVEIDGNLVYDIELDPFSSTAFAYSVLAAQTFSVTNSDDDAAGFTFTPTSLTTGEMGAPQTFTIRPNTDPLTDTVTVDIVSLDITEGTVSPATLSWTSADYTTAKTVTVTPVDDPIADGGATFDVELDPFTSTETNYSALAVQTVAVTNTDDDVAGLTVTPTAGLLTTEAGGTDSFTVVLNTEPDGDVVIDVVSNDTTEVTVDKAVLTFTTLDWSTAQTVTVTGVDDGLLDGSKAVTIALTIDGVNTTDGTGYAVLDPPDATATNSDNESVGATVSPLTGLTTTELGGTATFIVVLNTAPNGDVVIDVASIDTTEVVVDKAVLTFTTLDWTTAQTVTVTGVDDGVVDGNQIVTIALTIDPVNTTDTTGYDALDPPDVEVTNPDDDTVNVTVNPTGGLITSEAGGTDTFTVMLNTAPDGDVVIDVISNDTAEVTVDKATLVFTPLDWSTAQTVTATGIDDVVNDGNKNITIALTVDAVNTTDSTGYDLVDPADVSVINIDDDAAGISVNPTSGIVINEAGGTATFTVVLSTQPSADVTVGISSGDTSEALVQGGDSPATPVAAITLTFTSIDWATPQTVTVVGQDDALMDGNQVVIISTAAASSTDPNYNTLNPPDVVATNNDDDSDGILITPFIGLVVDETGGSDTFTVVLTSQPGIDVTIDVTSPDTAEVLVQGGDSPGTPVGSIRLTFTPADWSTGQMVTVVGQDDVTVDGNQTVIIDTVAGGDPAYAALDPVDVQVINIDDELPPQYPIISAIPDKSTPQDTTIEFILFTADEGVDPAEDVEILSVVGVTSSDQTLVPDANISWTFTDNGAGDGANGEITIVPAAGQTGTAAIILTVSDGTNSTQEIFALTVNAVVSPPTAYPISVSTSQNSAVALTLAAEDLVAGDAIISWTIDTGPNDGLLTGTPPNLTYNPDSGFSGRDSFTYYATDAGAESGNLAIVSLIVNGSAILFVGDAAAVLADDTVNYPGDVTVKNEIISLGFTVTVVDDNNVLSGAFNIADIDMVDLLIISSSNGSANFVNSPYMTDFRDTTTPVLIWERFLYDDFQMTVSSNPPDAGTVASTTQIDVTSENHPLAGGLANGTYTVFSSPVDLVWGDVSSDGEVVATVFDAGTGQNQPVVFVYETGDLMQGGLTAPAKRVGYFLPDFGLGNLTADGLTLLHAAFNEALAR